MRLIDADTALASINLHCSGILQRDIQRHGEVATRVLAQGPHACIQSFRRSCSKTPRDKIKCVQICWHKVHTPASNLSDVLARDTQRQGKVRASVLAQCPHACIQSALLRLRRSTSFAQACAPLSLDCDEGGESQRCRRRSREGTSCELDGCQLMKTEFGGLGKGNGKGIEAYLCGRSSCCVYMYVPLRCFIRYASFCRPGHKRAEIFYLLAK